MSVADTPVIPVHKLFDWAARTPDAPALHQLVGGGWQPVSWADYAEQVNRVADGLLALGLQPGERVGILSQTRKEWLFAQWGAMAAGAVVVPCYPTLTAEQTAYVTRHSEARVVFAGDRELVGKLLAVRDQLPGVERVVSIDPLAQADDAGGWVMTLDELLALAGPEQAALRDQRLAALDADADAFVVYTSGTTGPPKGVRITHRNLHASGSALLARYRVPTSRMISYLPLSHIAEQTATNLVQMETGGEVFLVSDMTTLPTLLPSIRPNALFGVPRVWEKVQAALEGKFAAERPLKRRLIDWALRVEGQAYRHWAETGEQRQSLARRLAHKLVIGKIKARLGMDQLVHALTGSAPSNPEMLAFFGTLGIHLNELYGLTETTGLVTTTMPAEYSHGTVGRPLDDMEFRLADDGEILARGPLVCPGYLNDEQATDELIRDGWLHTGDIGEVDEQGRLRITDRKKDIIVLAQAKNVAPQPIEARLKSIPGVSQAVVIGDRRPYLVALLTMDETRLDSLADELGMARPDIGSLLASSRFKSWIAERVGQINEGLARFETIKRFRVLDADFSIDAGQVTPTMKVKRSTIHEQFAEQIAHFYEGQEPGECEVWL